MMGWVLTGVSTDILLAVGGALAAATTLLYIIRVRRRRIEVPYAEVWRRVIAESRASSLWERLKRLLSWLLQLALLALILFALADPRDPGSVAEGRAVVLIIDTSASMSAMDEGGARSRLDRARELARDVLSGLGAHDEVMLVRMDGQLEPLTPFVDDPSIADEIVRELRPSATAADIREAIRYGVESLAGRPSGEIVIVSDGAFRAEHVERFDVSVPRHIDVTHIPVGTRAENVGITAFNVRRYPANRTNVEIYVQVRSYLDTPVTVELQIRGDSRLVEVERINLPPNGNELRIYSDLPAGGERLEASVTIVAGDAVDIFPMDDVAYAILPTRPPPRVLLVTPGNLYLEASFLLNESVVTERIDPSAYVASNAGDPSADFDITVFDGVTPRTAERGNFLYFGPSGEFSPWDVDADVVDPIIHTSRSNHPLLRHVTALRDMNITRARRLRVGRDDEVIASAIGGAPMIVARQTMTSRRLAVAFQPTQSDFPLRVAFPVFLLNALDWFTGDDGALIDGFRTGETWFIRLGDPALEAAHVTWPSGRQATVPATHGTLVLYGSEPGFYTIEAGGRTQVVAANLADPEESDVTPVADLVLGDLEISTEIPESIDTLRRDPWFLLVLVAFGLLTLEWLTWNRRWTV